MSTPLDNEIVFNGGPFHESIWESPHEPRVIPAEGGKYIRRSDPEIETRLIYDWEPRERAGTYSGALTVFDPPLSPDRETMKKNKAQKKKNKQKKNKHLQTQKNNTPSDLDDWDYEYGGSWSWGNQYFDHPPRDPKAVLKSARDFFDQEHLYFTMEDLKKL